MRKDFGLNNLADRLHCKAVAREVRPMEPRRSRSKAQPDARLFND